MLRIYVVHSSTTILLLTLQISYFLKGLFTINYNIVLSQNLFHSSLPPLLSKNMALLLPPPYSLRPLTLTTLNSTTSLSLLSVFSPFPSFSLPSLRLSTHHHLSNRSLRFLPSAPAASSAETTGTKPTVIVTEKLGEAGLAFLREFANVDCAYNLSQEELCAKISLCDAIIVRSGTKVLVLNGIFFYFFMSSFLFLMLQTVNLNGFD